jgi:hypothetical protein
VSNPNLAIGTPCTADLAGVGSVSPTLTALAYLSSTLTGTGTVSPTLTALVSLAAALSGTGALTGDATVLAYLTAALAGVGAVPNASATGPSYLTAALAGVGSISNAAMDAAAALAASLAGVGSINPDLSVLASIASSIAGLGQITPDPDLVGLANLTADLSGLASMTADCRPLAYLSANPAGVGSISNAATFVTVEMSADIIVSYTAVVDEAHIVQAVYARIVEGGLDLEATLRLLLAVAVGKTTIDSSGSPVIVTFRDTDDTKDRIIADMISSERTSVVLDPTD